ncbi:FecR family protein [Variovorax terrae]|uniref:FecR family protein n=1 Tax=Variovorax terrae TaxID=2923278 RepID=A0A9X1VTI5_9BURK|nr:FecR family protein [Variovorax terrae]MCJ0763586.1 FecR family protein [Variovorax terrae]
MKQQFKLKNAMLMMALAAAYPLHGHAAAGITQFTSGDVTLRRGAGTDPLTKGRDLESGDAIVTGPGGRAQIRFSDGGLVALQPNSQFNISNYADKNDPKQDSFFVDLLRGGMRAVTGLIGKRNRENFRVTTTTATIGIRGSAFNLAYNPDGSLSVATELDEIEVCTQAGCVGLTAGEAARVDNNQDLPVRTNARASLPTPAPRQTPEIVANQVNSSGTSAIIPPKPTTAPPPAPRAKALVGVALSGYGFTSDNLPDTRHQTNGTLVLAADGTPESYTAASGGANGTRTGAATIVSSTGSLETGDYLLIGTWDSSTWKDGASSSPLNVASSAFVVGVPTSSTSIASLAGQRGEYSLAHATAVLSSTGAVGTLLPTSKLSIDFLGAGNYANVNLDVEMPGTTPSGVSQALAVRSDNTTLYKLQGGVTGTGAGFAGSLSVSSDACIQGYASCGIGFVNGFVSGPNAMNAGLTYGGSSSAHGYFGGAATFTKGSQAAIPQSQSFTNMASAYAYGSSSNTYFYNPSFFGGFFSSYDANTYTSGPVEFYPSGAHAFNGDQLSSYYGGPYSRMAQSGTEPATFGALGKPTDSDFIGWGHWVKAETPYGYSGSSVMLDQVHYIVGVPTPAAQMPVSGTANYALVGGTAPTATKDGISQVGQLLGGSLSADFTYGSVSASIDTKFGNTAVTVSSQGASIYGASFSGGCGANIRGFFTGNMAYRAGLVYEQNDGALGKIAGAAAFQRSTVITPDAPVR